MKKNIKVIVSFLIVLGFFIVPTFAQQVTRFGVVDTFKVYRTYFRDSAPIRNYEKKEAEFQAELDQLTDELRSLQTKKLKYKEDGNDAMAEKIAKEISDKTQYVYEYTNAKNADLVNMQKQLLSSDEFYKKLANTLGKIAESGGYSAILSLQDANAILWYSPSVDITDQVIKALGL